jgi:phosphoesterase RecJ-like protein
MDKTYDKIWGMIEKAKNILVLAHKQPDADALGSAISLKILIENMGKQATMACYDKPSKKFSFLPHIDEFVVNFDLNDYDLMIFVDCGAHYMSNFHNIYKNIFTAGIPIVNIDHHASNDNFGDVNLVDPSAASATVIIYRLLNYWGISIDEHVAICLMAGIYNDTGGFMHSNTNEEVYKIAADLMKKGAKIGEVSKNLFHKNDVGTLKLWGNVFEKAYITSDKIAVSAVREEDYEKLKVHPEQLSGAVEYLSMIPDARFAVLLNEDRKGNVKASFRTRRDGIDVSKVAQEFGGGGHPKASGFSIPGKIKKEVKYTVVFDKDKKALSF